RDGRISCKRSDRYLWIRLDTFNSGAYNHDAGPVWRHMPHSFTFGRVLMLGFAGLAAVLVLGVQVETSAGGGAPPPSHRRLLDQYCVTCHNERLKTAGLR